MKRQRFNMIDRNPVVLVTGASGSLGYRLTEVLSLHMSIPVIAQVHSVVSAGRARLARLPCQVIEGDVTNPEGIFEHFDNVDVVVHCAFGTHGGPNNQRCVTVEGTRRMLESSIKHHVKKFIHLSSVVVVGHGLLSEVIDEDAPYQPCGDTYTDSKIEAEKIALSYAGSLPVIALRPTRIYGPRCDSWTYWPLIAIREGTAWLTDGGPGICPLVYIDNVVEAIMLSIKSEEADGEIFFVTDEENITWAQFYEDYCRIVGPGAEVESISSEYITTLIESKRPSMWRDSINGLVRMAGSGLHQLPRQVPAIRWLVDSLPKSAARSMVRTRNNMREGLCKPPSSSSEYEFLSEMDPGILQRNADAHTSSSVISIDKLRSKLGYRQLVTHEDGMRLTAQWARYARLTRA